MVRDWADLLVHVCRQIWKVFISLCLAIALTSTLVGLIIFCLSGTMGDFWWSLIKDGEQTSVHAVAELMWFIQVFLGHLCSSGAEKSWMPILERSGHLNYARWHLQLFWFLIDEVSFKKKSSHCGFSCWLKTQDILWYVVSQWKESRKKQRKIVKYLFMFLCKICSENTMLCQEKKITVY